MHIEKNDVKHWLKSIGKDREWLALQCQVDKRAVDSWLSTKRAIPSHAIIKLTQLMNETTAEQEAQLVSSKKLTIFVDLDFETFKNAESQALEAHETLSEYCAELITQCCSIPNIINELSAIKSTPSAEVVPERNTVRGLPPTAQYKEVQ